MRSGNFDWIWLVVVAVAWLLQFLAKRRSAGKGDKPPAAPKPSPKRSPQARREPVVQAKPFGGRQAAADRVRGSRDQTRRGAQPPAPAPPAPAPIRETVSAATPAPEPPPSPSPIAQPQPTPASFWAGALRDKQNLRHIFISAEIIGPPKGA
jgi:hypothetical protein